MTMAVAGLLATAAGRRRRRVGSVKDRGELGVGVLNALGPLGRLLRGRAGVRFRGRVRVRVRARARARVRVRVGVRLGLGLGLGLGVRVRVHLRVAQHQGEGGGGDGKVAARCALADDEYVLGLGPQRAHLLLRHLVRVSVWVRVRASVRVRVSVGVRVRG
jgi:hypothetical protein